METANYYITLADRNGKHITTKWSPIWYGITEQMMMGICIGMKMGDPRKTVQVLAYTLTEDNKPGNLIRAQH